MPKAAASRVRYDAKGLLIASINTPDPVIFFEPKILYRKITDEDVPITPYEVSGLTFTFWRVERPCFRVVHSQDWEIVRSDAWPRCHFTSFYSGDHASSSLLRMFSV